MLFSIWFAGSYPVYLSLFWYCSISWSKLPPVEHILGSAGVYLYLYSTFSITFLALEVTLPYGSIAPFILLKFGVCCWVAAFLKEGEPICWLTGACCMNCWLLTPEVMPIYLFTIIGGALLAFTSWLCSGLSRFYVISPYVICIGGGPLWCLLSTICVLFMEALIAAAWFYAC